LGSLVSYNRIQLEIEKKYIDLNEAELGERLYVGLNRWITIDQETTDRILDILLSSFAREIPIIPYLEAKQVAKKLKYILKTYYDIHLSHTKYLHIVSNVYGYDNWDAMYKDKEDWEVFK